MKNGELRYVSLFSGIGGFELGIHSAGDALGIPCVCVMASEIDEHARRIYRKQFGVMPHGDITTINAGDVPDHDLLVAGFPCQPFSMAGNREGIVDDRGALFFQIVRIIQEKRPQYLVFENVRGLLSSRSPTTSAYVRQILNDEIIGNKLWEKRFTPIGNWKILIDYLIAYLQEKLPMNLDSKSHKSGIYKSKNSELTLESPEHVVELGLKKNLKYFAEKILQTMRSSSFYQEGQYLQYDVNVDDLTSILNRLCSIDNLNQTDIYTLERMVGMLGEIEKLLRKYSDAHLTSLRLYTTSTEIQPTIDQKICTYVQDLNITLFIVMQRALSTNLWKKVTSNLTGKTESTYYVKTFNLFVDMLRDLGYDCEWELLNTKIHGQRPQNRERVYLVGHLRAAGDDWEPIFPIGRQGAEDGGVRCDTQGERSWIPCINTRYGERYVCETYVRQRNPGVKRVHSLQQRNPNRPSLKYSHGGSGPLSKDDGTSYCCDSVNAQAIELSGDVIRKLTPVEYERLQAFPDNWTQTGIEEDPVKNKQLRNVYLRTYTKLHKQGRIRTDEYAAVGDWVNSLPDNEVPISDTQRYKCVGNAVTTTVVQAVVEPILRSWSK